MIFAKQLAYTLSLIGIVTMRGSSVEAGGEYVAPEQAVPRGQAPKMQVELLNPGEPTKQYAVIFYQGDEAFSGLLEFAEKYHVTSAHFTAIGALNKATLGWFDPQRKNVQEDPHQRPARSDCDERRHCTLPRKACSPHAHGSWESGRNNACGPCSRCLRIADAGSDGDGRAGSDAEAV
jgi:hypothetical protein